MSEPRQRHPEPRVITIRLPWRRPPIRHRCVCGGSAHGRRAHILDAIARALPTPGATFMFFAVVMSSNLVDTALHIAPR